MKAHLFIPLLCLSALTTLSAEWREASLDGGTFSYQEIEGDFDLTAMVGALPKHGRVALMVRESLAVDARLEMIYVMEDGRVGTDARLGELAYHSPGKSESPKPMPIRLRAARCGDEIALYVVDAQPTTLPEFLQTTRQPLADSLGVVVGFMVDGWYWQAEVEWVWAGIRPIICQSSAFREPLKTPFSPPSNSYTK